MSSPSYSVYEFGGSWFCPVEHHTDVARACISAESLTQLHPEQRFRVYDNNRQQFIDSGGVVYQTHRYQVYVEINNRWCPMTRFGELEQVVAWICGYDPDRTIDIKVKDHEECRFIELDELFSVFKRPEKEGPNSDWKEEGF